MSLTQEQVIRWCEQQITEAPDFPLLETCLDAIEPLSQLADLPAGTRVLVRGDTDVVINDQGEIEEDVRLQSLVETLKFGIEHGWVMVLFGHRGRKPELSLKHVAPHLVKLLTAAGVANPQISFVPEWMDDATGGILDAAGQAVAAAPNGSVVLLENTRRYPLETALWKAKAADLPKLAERITRYATEIREKIAKIHVNEGFASSNRDLSSTVVPLVMDRNAFGSYIDRELRQYVTRTRQADMVVFSGLKINKLDDLDAILKQGKVRFVLTAGNLALSLMKADADLAGKPFELGQAGDSSKPEAATYIPPDRIEQAKRMLQTGRANGVTFILPCDFTLADGSAVDAIPAGGAQFDIGPKTVARHEQGVGEFIEFHKQKVAAGKGNAVMFHNGVFGMFEKEEYANGTRAFVNQLKRMNDAGVEVYVGGGEGGFALTKYGDESWVTHCFTAGGTILKALGSEPIPYVKALYLAAKR